MDQAMHTTQSYRKFSGKMLIQNFRTAAKGLGQYCPDRNELRVRKGRKLYRFTCEECELRFAVSARPEVVLLVAPDTTVRELRCWITGLINSPE